MKKIIFSLVLLPLFFTGCKEDSIEKLEVHDKVEVQVVSDIDGIDYSELQVEFTNLDTQKVYNTTVNSKGVAELEIPNNNASYNIVVESSQNDINHNFFGERKNILLSRKYKVLTVSVNEKRNYKGLVLDELYFNGTSNGNEGGINKYTYYEQYFTITNSTDQEKNAAGLSFGICGDYNNTKISSRNKMRHKLPTKIVMSQIYTIPNTNDEKYKLQPGESLVIALWARNHNVKSNPNSGFNSIDLSGADLEIFVPHKYVQTEDTDVPNVDVNFTTFEAFHWQATGSSPLVLLDLKTNVNDYVRNHKKKFNNPAASGQRKQDYVVVPAKYIIDGVETGSKGTFYRKVLPNTIDRTYFKIPGDGMPGTGYGGYFIKRKRKNGMPKDTNKSNNDFVLLTGGQKSYPKN